MLNSWCCFGRVKTYNFDFLGSENVVWHSVVSDYNILTVIYWWGEYVSLCFRQMAYYFGVIFIGCIYVVECYILTISQSYSNLSNLCYKCHKLLAINLKIDTLTMLYFCRAVLTKINCQLGQSTLIKSPTLLGQKYPNNLKGQSYVM